MDPVSKRVGRNEIWPIVKVLTASLHVDGLRFQYHASLALKVGRMSTYVQGGYKAPYFELL